MSHKIQIYDPPMCCSTGACGPQANPELVRFAADIDWLQHNGVTVERFNLTGHPQAFADTACVRETLQKVGNACLPLFVVNAAEVHRGSYPSREELCQWVGITAGSSSNATQSPAGCGPGCGCTSTSASSRLPKAILFGVIAVVVAGILLYKFNRPATPAPTTEQQSFASLVSTSATQAQSVEVVPAPEKTPATDIAPAIFGAPLKSFRELTTLAAANDAVCIFVPASGGGDPRRELSTATQTAQASLKKNKVSLGLYRLDTASSEYKDLITRFPVPALLIASKGGGMSVLAEGDVTEPKILQTYLALQSRGCGPSSCGPSSGGCK